MGSRPAPDGALTPGSAAAGLVLLGTFARFWRLDLRSIWYDEAGALWRATLPDLVAVARAPDWIEPPAYFLALHAWLAQGHDEATARALSAVVSAAGLGIAWEVFRRLLSAPAALAALALLAAAPFQVLYAQQVRPYALVVTLELGCLVAVLRAVEGGGTRWWAWASLAACLAGLTHYVALIWIPCLGAFLRLSGLGGHTALVRWAGWGAAAATPPLALAFLVRDSIGHATAVPATRVPLADYGIGTLQQYAGSAYVPPTWWAAAAAGCAALALLGIRRGPAPAGRRGFLQPSTAAVVALGLLPWLGVWLAHRAGLLYAPKIRYALVSQVFLLAAVGRGVMAMPGRASRAAALTACLLVQGAALSRYFAGGFPGLDLPPCQKPFRDAAAIIARGFAPGDAVVSSGFVTFVPLRWYLGARPQSYPIRDPFFEEAALAEFGLPVPLEVTLRSARRIWLVSAPVFYTAPLDVPEAVLAPLRRAARLEMEQDLPGIRLQRWRVAPK